MSENKHITFNEYGTPVLAENNINVVTIGESHEGGSTEAYLLEQYQITRAQLHAALSYFYENRDEIRAYQDETDALLKEVGTDAQEAIDKMRKGFTARIKEGNLKPHGTKTIKTGG